MAAALVAALVASVPAAGQTFSPPTAASFVSRSWTVDDGLPVNAVTGAAQGREGYLWLTTYAGLVRFDGVRFTTVTSETTPAFPTDRLLGLTPAPGGAFWIRTEALAIVRFNPVLRTFERFADGLEGTQTRVVLPEPDGTLWVGTDAGLFVRRGRRFVRAGGAALAGSVFGLVRDRAGALWVGTTTDGVFRLAGGRLQHFTAAAGLALPWIDQLLVDADGALWAGTQTDWLRYRGGRFVPGGAPRRPPGAWTFRGREVRLGGRLVFTAGSDVLSVTEDREGNGWVTTTSDGLTRLHPALFTVYGEPEGLGGRYVYSVLQDRAGALWFGTATSGLNRLRGGTVDVFRPPALPSLAVSATYEDDRGRLWVGHDRGLCRFDGPVCTPVAGLDLPPVVAVLQDRGGAFWLASARRLCRWSQGDTLRCLGPADGLPDAAIRVVRQTADGALWIGTDDGLARLQNGRIRVFTTAGGLSGNGVRSLHEDTRGALWVGTGGRGLNRITDLGAERPRVARIRERDGLADDVVYALVADGRGRLWMSTNRGIAWARLAELDAVADGRAARVHTALYTEADGMRNREGNGSQQGAIRARDGRLWFATQDGAAVVDPARVGTDGATLPVRVEAVASAGEMWAAGAPVRLDARHRSFEVAYTALTFVAPEAVQFRYRLDGFDRGWVEAGTRRTAFYTRVPPGRYTFRVAARRRDGRWAAAPPVAVTVAPFAYETAWFRGLLGLLLAGAVAGAFRWRTQRLHRRAEALEREVDARTGELVAANAAVSRQAERLREMDEAKNRLFANLSHEFRTPLTLILGPLQSGIDGAYGPVPDPLRSRDTLMLRNGRRLLRLVNQVLDLARLEAGGLALHPAPHDLPAFVRQTALAFAPLAERQRIILTVDVDGAPATAVFDREQVERILGNLLSNALKFTPRGGRVHVVCRAADTGGDGQAGRALEVVVSDTGLGIAPELLGRVFERFFQVDASATRAQEGSGIGLALARELAELHGGTLTATSTLGGPDGGPSGSRFTLRLPQPDGAAGALAPVVPGVAPEEPTAPPATGAVSAETGDAATSDETPDQSPDAAEASGGPGAPSEPDRTTVLVVDDNADLRAYLRHVLEPHYRVVEASDGAEALARTREALPDLVVADVMMPVMDGLAFTCALRADPATDGVPVVLLTARSETADELAGLATGADDFVTKPFVPETLLARVANLIALRQRLRERLRADGAPAAPETSAEAPFTATVRAAVLAHLTDGAFTVEALAAEVALSYSQLNRRLTAEAGVSPLEFVRRVRLDAAAQLLADGAGTVSEVAYAVGFNSLAHFSRAFRAQFGMPPSAYAASVR